MNTPTSERHNNKQPRQPAAHRQTAKTDPTGEPPPAATETTAMDARAASAPLLEPARD